MSYFTLPPVDEDTKQKLLNGTWPSYFDIDLKRIQMLKVDVATIMSNQGSLTGQNICQTAGVQFMILLVLIIFVCIKLNLTCNS